MFYHNVCIMIITIHLLHHFTHEQYLNQNLPINYFLPINPLRLTINCSDCTTFRSGFRVNCPNYVQILLLLSLDSLHVYFINEKKFKNQLLEF